MLSQLPDPEIIDDREVDNGEFLSIHKRTVKIGEEIIERELIQRRDGVAIIPVDVDQNVLLIREYSPGSNSFLYTLPGGHIEEGEIPEVAARRELREETGYNARQIIKLRYTYSHPAISTRKSYSFLGYALIADPLPSENEYIEVHRLPLEEAIQLVYQDFVSDMSTIGDLLMARDKLREMGL
jgi:ADP-ribose pyrophosphatase